MSDWWSGLTNIGREAAKIVLPSICVVCDGDLPWRNRRASCCESCWTSLPRLTGSKCRRCATPWPGEAEYPEFVCLECQTMESPTLEWLDAWGSYDGGLQKIIHAFKFERHDFLAGPLADLLVSTFESRAAERFDAVTAVPMHRRRLRQRGYNQAELLARRFAKRTSIQNRSTDLTTNTERKVQSSLPRSQRAENVCGAFSASPRLLGLAVLLIDDVCTTGETLRACSGALRSAGATRVAALTVARAL